MAIMFGHMPRWLWGHKKHESAMPTSPCSSSSSSSTSSGSRDLEMLKLPSMLEGRRRGRKKFQSRSERRIDREYDVVLVPSDGGCISGSESDDSDWSIGWFEPHAPDFSSENESENSFAVLVPCYGLPHSERMDSMGVFSSGAKSHKTQLLDAVLSNLSNNAEADESKRYMEQWLSSLHEH